MNKKGLTIGMMFLVVSGILSSTLFFIFAYDPTFPAKLDDTGSTEQGIQEVVKANNQFALELYSKLNEDEEGNIFYSPYSIFSALAITYEGAGGQTAEEMESVFHFPEKSILRPNYAALFNSINRERTKYELRTANALWTHYDYTFIEDYTNRIESFYGGKATNVDFVSETEKSRQLINKYIEKQTKDNIKELIPPGSIDSMTRLVITNAIYFKGAWEWEFDESDTSEQEFTISSNNVVSTPMMYMDPEETKFNYANLEDLQILELPYKGDKISMLILLPKINLDAIEPSFTAEKLYEYKDQMHETSLDGIYLPKFEFDTKYFMKEALSSLGMPNAFEENANFSGMTTAEALHISRVIHQAYVKVDEEGTEAAAATAVGMFATSMPPIFSADHPFIFIIQDKETGNILFMGRVFDPTD